MQTIDMTPTWRGLLPLMLELWQTKKVRNADDLQLLKKEFAKMAEAADKWNEHCRRLAEEAK